MSLNLNTQKNSLSLNYSRITKIAGITRVSEITGLDVIGLPTYIAVRPGAYLASKNKQGLISIYNGKGQNKKQAKLSAIMEGVERYSAEPFDRDPVILSYQNLSAKERCLSPNQLLSPSSRRPSFDQAPLEWIKGKNLINRSDVWVPAEWVFLPYVYPPGTTAISSVQSSNGLAAGESIAQASASAILEVIERFSLETHISHSKKFDVPLETLRHNKIQRILKNLERLGIKIGIKYYQNKWDIPVFSASIDDPHTQDPYLFCHGSGAHLCKDTALFKAVSEAIQTRLTVISGVREDIYSHQEIRNPEVFEEMNHNFQGWIKIESPISYENIPESAKDPSSEEYLSILLRKLKNHGYEDVIAVDLTRPELKIPVIRAIIPGLHFEMKPHDFEEDILKSFTPSEKKYLS